MKCDRKSSGEGSLSYRMNISTLPNENGVFTLLINMGDERQQRQKGNVQEMKTNWNSDWYFSILGACIVVGTEGTKNPFLLASYKGKNILRQLCLNINSSSNLQNSMLLSEGWNDFNKAVYIYLGLRYKAKTWGKKKKGMVKRRNSQVLLSWCYCQKKEESGFSLRPLNSSL